MTDKERLEEIKEIYRWAIENSIANRIADSDIDWLIQQAERVQELEEEVEKQKNRKYLKMRQRDDFMKKAQYYKQALEFYADEEHYKENLISKAEQIDGNWVEPAHYEPPIIYFDKGETARKALEGTKNEC